MTIEKTIEVPDDRRVVFEFLVPKDIPAGPAKVELKVTPAIETQLKPFPEEDEKKPTPRADALLGILSHLGDISLEEIRAERLAKYLK